MLELRQCVDLSAVVPLREFVDRSEVLQLPFCQWFIVWMIE